MAAPAPVLQLESCAVIGDIHGRADLLEPLLARLEARPVFVLGDLCDRGPETRRVLDLLVARGARGVRGNHDEWLSAWASGAGFDPFALHPMMGGEATLASYGVQGRTAREIEAERWRVPEAHREFLSRLQLMLELEVGGQDYVLVHAGIPATARVRAIPEEQRLAQLREHHGKELLWSKHDPRRMPAVGRTVVMGHMPMAEPLDTGEVIAIDTGAATLEYGGALTALLLPERRFVTVHASE